MTDALALAADLLDPKPWSAPAGRPPLEPHQRPPDGIPGRDWTFWLLQAGRGAGKTEACARYFAAYMNQHPGTRGRIIAPTLGDAIEACIEGPSGLQAIDPSVRWVPSASGGSKVFWPNGSVALVLGAHTKKDIDRLRAAGNRTLDWFEELAAMHWAKDAWEQAEFGRRIGAAHAIASTTPKSTADYRFVRAQASHISSAKMSDNPHLDAAFKARIETRYGGTALGRQEIEGELIEDAEGALWKRRVLDAGRVTDHPDLVRVGVALDPAATSGPNADDTGIMVAGVGVDGHGYVLADRTCHLPPEGWATRALRAYEQYDADRIIGEVNNGGEMVEATIAAQAKLQGIVMPPYKAVSASRGKATRAEPVATLFGNPPKRPAQLHMVGTFPELEDQLCNWVPGDEDSPDRLDALVWAVTDLMLSEQGSGWHPL